MEEELIGQRLESLLEREDEKIESALLLLYGQLPQWFPSPRLEQARRIISQLTNDGFTTQQIAKFANDELVDELIVPGIVRDSRAFIHLINELAHIKYALSLPENECLRLLSGEQAAKGRKFSLGGTTKAKKEYEPKASIRKICERIESTQFDDVLEVLRDADKCGDWYESTSAPIGVLFVDVDDVKKEFSYLPRGALPDKPKSRSFGRLRNILTEIKKSK